MQLRGQRVFARVDENGNLTVDRGRVEIRYKAQSPRAYHASPGNLEVDANEPILPDTHCALDGEDGAPAKKPRTKRGIKAPTSDANPPLAPEANEYLFYADGACSGNPGPAGLGIVMLFDDKRREFSEFLGHGTNNVAELTAILRACEAVTDASRPVRVYTDSNYSIGVLTKSWKARANQELIRETKQALLRLKDVELRYVRGHHGIPLNERADELARQAVSTARSTGWIDLR